ncbi:hypothetical protein [Gloeothece verrucosa]|uniref:Uncharacterized protein n=1 Tax=Gloeothece verrucosa (strain PCC 7822) TaxID=497965 RepID=E0UNK9_GLOV7|nr:hypothetical protein [Gloeothece verrucosa]ADN18539.1 hypothetical protein Cyan7822_6895 [Gloeothece verrucosa PCC 7822]
MKTLIYSSFPLNCIPDSNGRISTRHINGQRIQLSYCSGWGDFPHLEISLIGCWSSWDNSIRLYPERAFSQFQKVINSSELIVGFNSLRFDDNLCYANGIEIKTNYDLLTEVWAAAGMPREYTWGVTRKGYNLKNLVAANTNIKLLEKKELAPIFWQRGQQWAVADYLVNEILALKQIWIHRDNLIDPIEKTVGLHLRGYNAPLGTESRTIISPISETEIELQELDEIPL